MQTHDFDAYNNWVVVSGRIHVHEEKCKKNETV